MDRETGPETDQTGPEIEEPGPETEEPGPHAGQTGPVAEQTGPVAEQTGPLAEQTGPLAEQTGPVAEQTGPVAEQTAPVAEQTAPLAEQTGPAAPAGAREYGQASPVPSARPPVSAGLGSDPRLPIWILRAVMAAVAGVAVSIWQDWRLGLTAAALVAIADTVYRSKTMAIIPASARVTSAQRRTRRRLFLLRHAGYVALTARAIPGSESVIDHLVIGPAGVVALDSERWDRRLPVRTGAGTQLYHGPFNQRERLRHARWEAERASTLVGAQLGREIDVQAAMAIYGPTIPWVVTSLRGVDVFAGRKLRKYLRRRARASGKRRLGASQVDDICEAASRALPPA